MVQYETATASEPRQGRASYPGPNARWQQDIEAYAVVNSRKKLRFCAFLEMEAHTG
jgi:hypothetical protein